MATKVAINGFGRIGRAVARILFERGNMELVAINDLAPAKSLAHLFKYDTVMGPWKGTVECKDDSIVINGKEVKVLAVRNPAELPWKDMGVEIAVESTGVFRTKESPKGGYGDHLKAGAKKVVLTVPAKDDIDATASERIQCRFARHETARPKASYEHNGAAAQNGASPAMVMRCMRRRLPW